jgi:hypothetical protein
MKVNNPINAVIKIGKYVVNPSTSTGKQLTRYTWDDAISKKIVKSVTKNNVEKLFNNLGIKPIKVEVEPVADRLSIYVFGEVNGTKIIYARRESDSEMAGQTKVYSPYAVVRLLHIKDLSKDEILQALKIPN